MKKRRVLIIFGTRPEAIKMAPLVNQLKAKPEVFETAICVTAQHREMLDQVLNFFNIIPEYDLNLMRANQNLYTLTCDIILNLKNILEDYKPDFIFVHGDTSTSMASAIAGFYSGAKICHVEAGLRTYNKLAPFPEEMNRQITARIADYHFAPTTTAKQNLLTEGIEENKIIVTGNTVIDALLQSAARVENIDTTETILVKSLLKSNKKTILITGHRRENHGDRFNNICEALKAIALQNADVQLIYPLHLNPNIKETALAILSNINNIHLIKPLSYPAFVLLMKNSYIIITDSGGIQEEAPSLGKPVLVMRDTSERPEAIEKGTVILVGSDKEKIIQECNRLLHDENWYNEMAKQHNPYGDGHATERIVDFIEQVTY